MTRTKTTKPNRAAADTRWAAILFRPYRTWRSHAGPQVLMQLRREASALRGAESDTLSANLHASASGGKGKEKRHLAVWI